MISAIGSTNHVGMTAGQRNVASSSGASDDFAAILAAFEKAATETPAEKARRHVLERHKLSEEGYRQLPPEERKAIDREIVEAVARATKAKTDSRHAMQAADARFSIERLTARDGGRFTPAA